MVVQLLEVRKILESWAAAEASRLATEENIRTLETVYQDLERDFQNDELGVDADVRFHLSIYRATQNTVLSHIASTLLALLHQTQRVTRQVMFTETVNKERLLQQHHAILSAIRERNPEKAREAILTHLDYAENYFVTRSSKVKLRGIVDAGDQGCGRGDHGCRKRHRGGLCEILGAARRQGRHCRRHPGESFAGGKGDHQAGRGGQVYPLRCDEGGR